MDPQVMSELKLHKGDPKHRREQADFMLAAAKNLEPRDRALITLVYCHGAKISDVAAAAGVEPASMYSRLRTLDRALSSREARLLIEVQDNIPPGLSELAVSVIVCGMNIPEAAEKHGVPLAWARKKLKDVHDWLEQQVRTTGARKAVV